MDELTMEQWEMGIYEDAVETWGREAQMMKAAEELSELAAAINRLLCCEVSGYRSREEVMAELQGEWCDAEIMLNQLHVMLDMDDEVYIGKLEALEEKIRKARENAVCKSINSPDPFADVEEKREAIRTILGAATLNSMTKQDLLRVIRWMWDGDMGMMQVAAKAITVLLARAEAAEERCKALDDRCKRLDEARERANEATAKWEGMYLMALERADMTEETASDLCDDFTNFVTGGVHNAAPYCANRRPECVNAYGWCDGNNRVCRGFMPKAAGQKEG